jgi:Na+/H+ antiporter NhaB
MIDDQSKALQAVMEHATELGLRGVMILSPVCASCGQLHDFKMCSSLDEEQDTTGLLKHFAAVSVIKDPELIVVIERRLQ